MAKSLTVKQIEAVQAGAVRREIPDGLLVGLYCIVQPTGARSWAVRYRSGGKPCKLTLGPYPALDLATARARAREVLSAVAAGRDPGAEKKESFRKAKEGTNSRDLVSTQLDSFYERHVKPNNSVRTAAEVMRALDKDVRTAWGSRRVQDVTRRDVIELLDGIVDRGTPIAANRALAYTRRFFNWLVERSVLETSPCDRVRAPSGETDRDQILTDDELRWLWKATDRLKYPFGPFVRLLLLTGQRRDEVAKARHREFPSPELWQLPKERTKTGVATDVPLSAAAQEVIASLPRIAGRSGYLFTTNGETAISGYSDAKERLDKHMLAVAREEAIERGRNPEQVELRPWRLHDLRRTVASGMARLGHPPHVVEAVLNHTAGQISGVAKVTTDTATPLRRAGRLRLGDGASRIWLRARPRTSSQFGGDPMAKKIAAHDPTDQKTIEDREFYRKCNELLQRPLTESEWDGIADPEVKEVVFGLAYITNALANFKPNLSEGADEQTRRLHTVWLAQSGLKAAGGLVDAILKGHDHPIFAFIRGCRGDNASARPPEGLYRSRKPYLFGTYRALIVLHGMTKRQASALVSKRFGEYGPTLAPQTIKDTDKRLSKDICGLADRFRDHLLKLGGNPDEICERAILKMKLALSPPVSPKGGDKSPG